MAFHPFMFGSVDLPSVAGERRPFGRPDGVRVVRRPRPTTPEARP